MISTSRGRLVVSLLTGLALVACSETSTVAPATPPLPGVSTPNKANAALLPGAGILALATQLIATSGETPLIARAWIAVVGAQPNGYSLDALWADPISGKGWAMYDDNLSLSGVTNHYWITGFTWPAATTDFTVVQAAMQSALVESIAGTRGRTSVDDFGRATRLGTLTGIQQLIWDAAYVGANKPSLTLQAERIADGRSAIYTPGHTVKLVEMWATLDFVAYAPGRTERRAHGTYLMSVDNQLSTHAFCLANTVDIAIDFGSHVGTELMHNAEKSLGLPIDPITVLVAVGDTIETNTCPSATH